MTLFFWDNVNDERAIWNLVQGKIKKNVFSTIWNENIGENEWAFYSSHLAKSGQPIK